VPNYESLYLITVKIHFECACVCVSQVAYGLGSLEQWSHGFTAHMGHRNMSMFF